MTDKEKTNRVFLCDFCDDPIETNYIEYLKLESCEHINAICKDCFERNLMYECDICGKILCPKCVTNCQECNKTLCKDNGTVANGSFSCKRCESGFPKIRADKIVTFFNSNFKKIAHFIKEVEAYNLLRYYIQEKPKEELRNLLNSLVDQFSKSNDHILFKNIFHALSPYKTELDLSKFIKILSELNLKDDIYVEKIINLWELS